MRKYIWGITAGVCVLALLVAGIIFLPPLIMNDPPSDELDEGHMILTPGHWWKMEITDGQRGTLATLWGQDVSLAELLGQLWPGVLQEFPQDVVSTYENRTVGWATDTHEEWTGTMICNGTASFPQTGAIHCCLYIGSHDSEDYTFETVSNRGFTEEKSYRVSIYTADEAP